MLNYGPIGNVIVPTFTPAAFDYYPVESLDEAIRLVQNHEDAKVLAGGQSLLAMMKLRLIAPKVLVDISKVPGLNYMTEKDGEISVGALTTHQAIHESALLKLKCPLLSEAAARIGDVQIRNRGTIGGSISHADPSADYPPALLALDCKVVAKGPSGERAIDANRFFLGPFETALEPAELVTEVRMPAIRPNEGHGYVKFIRRESEFAIVNVAVRLALGKKGRVELARIALGAVADHAVRAESAEKIMEGKVMSEELIEDASNAVVEGMNPPADTHASADYRRYLAKVWTKRLLQKTLVRLEGGKAE